ncbi:MAG TPA: HPr-rel-A system PqqD family peptide chaperone [Allosphingosinicella sp.]|jgi:PqqD family protein of HPr-rel-A system
MAGARYAADPPRLIRSVELDGLTAIYHRRSGLTHILAPPAPQILEALAGEPGTAAEIAARIGERFEIAEEDVASALEARLGELEAAGLVWRL